MDHRQPDSNERHELGDLTQSRRAVAYVRMSTEHQQYSTENQCDIIREYAANHNLRIIRIYSDEGKSGLQFDSRKDLKRLIEDATSSERDFDVILVYDISRWGRFQDADESAYYEYVCRRTGVDVHYCAEQFANDGSPLSTIMKSIKRTMAGEYSRELSTKVFKGQCRLIELGYRQGGPAGFGLRRMLVDHTGSHKGILPRGEHKSIQTDRVILQAGPDHEVEIVRWMYEQFVPARRTEAQIADDLNSRSITTDLNKPWTRGTVHQVLTNEKYIGNNVYNRTSCKLKSRRVQNAPNNYVRCDDAFEPIVDKEIFLQAQQIISDRSHRLTNDQLIEQLKVIYDRHGHLSALIIDEYDDVPSSSVYRSRFGSLICAYRMVGYIPEHDYTYLEANRRLRKLHPAVVDEIVTNMVAAGAQVLHDTDTDMLIVNDEFTVSVIVSRCIQKSAGCRWIIRFDTVLKPDITVAVRMDSENTYAQDYYILPSIDIVEYKLSLAQNNSLLFDSYRFDNLDYLIRLARRAHILEVA